MLNESFLYIMSASVFTTNFVNQSVTYLQLIVSWSQGGQKCFVAFLLSYLTTENILDWSAQVLFG